MPPKPPVPMQTIPRLLAPLLLALAGCAAVDPIEMSTDPAKLPPFKTYRIEEEQLVFATTITDQERAAIASEMRKAVTSALTERGYRESTDADVLVSLGAVSRPTFEDVGSSHDSPIRNVDPSVVEAGRPPVVPTSDIGPSGIGREGDLFLYLLDPKTKRVVWRASTSGSATTPSEAKRKARATYGAMVAKLPKAPA